MRKSMSMPIAARAPGHAEQMSVKGSTAMRIPIAGGTGEGETELAAFDAALVQAGVADRNLIVLSSVLPPGSRVDRMERIADTPGFWGDRLYCVLAQARTSVPDTEVWAGIGWMQDETGLGLLVEHHAASEPALRALMEASLRGLARNRKRVFPRAGAVITGAHCTGTPVCALVVAAFTAEPWHRPGDP